MISKISQMIIPQLALHSCLVGTQFLGLSVCLCSSNTHFLCSRNQLQSISLVLSEWEGGSVDQLTKSLEAQRHCLAVVEITEKREGRSKACSNSSISPPPFFYISGFQPFSSRGTSTLLMNILRHLSVQKVIFIAILRNLR